MFRRLFFLSTLAITFFPACASSQAPKVGTATTTSATLDRKPTIVIPDTSVTNDAPWCTLATTFCATNHDCCSHFCFEGLCQ